MKSVRAKASTYIEKEGKKHCMNISTLAEDRDGMDNDSCCEATHIRMDECGIN